MELQAVHFSLIPFYTKSFLLILRGLRDRDKFSRSDPVCFAYAKGRGSRTWGALGRTERTKDTTNPEWATTFLIDYYFEEKQASCLFNVCDRVKNLAN